MRWTRRTIGLAIAAVLIGPACSDTTETTASQPEPTAQVTTSSVVSTSAVCEPLQSVVRLSAEAGPIVNEPMLEISAVVEQGEALDEASEKQLMDDFREAVVEAGALLSQVREDYEDALSVAPPDLRNDLVALRDSTVAFWPILVEAAEASGTIDELNAALEQGMPDSKIHEVATAGRAAALRLDKFTVPQCGFKMSNL